MTSRIALVPPRFGPQVLGGAEAVIGELARGLAGRGWEVDVLTTCAVDHYTWANDLPAGVTVEDGMTVHRFANVHHGSSTGLRAQQKIQAEILPTLDEQIAWLSWRFAVPGLFDHLLRHGADYDAVVFAPYLFWTTTVCLPLVADRAVLIPCLHDEFYARLDVVRPVLADAARIWLLSEPEHDLAHRLGPLGPHEVTGAGFDPPAGYDPDRFRRRYGRERPFVLYAGRREPEKGWNWIVDRFTEAVVDHGLDLDLVSIGVGEFDPPATVADRVVDLGRIPDADRDDAMAAAVAYVQPSRMESFSRSVMEAWMAGTPVLAIETSEVVAWHCRRSGGGLLFGTGAELAGHLGGLLADPARRAELGAAGRSYVLEHYTWPVVLDGIEASLGAMR